jgi:hypothetical protein
MTGKLVLSNFNGGIKCMVLDSNEKMVKELFTTGPIGDLKDFIREDWTFQNDLDDAFESGIDIYSQE